MTITSGELKAIMANCYGTESYYRCRISPMKYTDGVLTFAKNAEAIWFIRDVQVFRKEAIKENPEEYMFSVHLIVKEGKGDLIFKDAKGHICFKYHYSNTDCPDGDWLFYYYVEEDLLIWNGEY